MESFLERLECYFLLSKTTAADKKVQTLIMGLSTSQYDSLRALVYPAKPMEADYGELVETLARYFGQPRHYMLERHEFRLLKKNSGESVYEFAARLQSKAKLCEFRDILEVNLVEQFLSGLNDVELCAKLLETATDEDLRSFKTMLERAAMRAKVFQVNVKMEPDSTLAAVSKNRGRRCQRCGGYGHDEKSFTCPAKDRNCHSCKLKGHYASSSMCKNYQKSVSAINEGDADVTHAIDDSDNSYLF